MGALRPRHQKRHKPQSANKTDDLINLNIEYLKSCLYDKLIKCRERKLRLNVAYSPLTEKLYVDIVRDE